jgi:hypothetical protein
MRELERAIAQGRVLMRGGGKAGAERVIRACCHGWHAKLLLGHCRPSVALDIYSHLIDPDESIARTVQSALESDGPRANR